MAVVVDSGPLEPTYSARDVAAKDWPRLVRLRKSHINREITYDCRCVAQFIREAGDLWESCGYESADDLIANGYGLEPEEIRIVARWLELNDPKEAVGFEDVKSMALGSHGGDRKSEAAKENFDQVDNVKLIHRGGNDPTYLSARLERDRPDLKARVDAGEIPSVRQAAIKAGIVKPRVSIPADAAGASRAIVKHFKGDDLTALVRELANWAGFDLTPRND